MKSQPIHDMLPPATLDEEALQQFITSMGTSMFAEVVPRRRNVAGQRVERRLPALIELAESALHAGALYEASGAKGN